MIFRAIYRPGICGWSCSIQENTSSLWHANILTRYKSVNDWCLKWLILLNKSKWSVMPFSHKRDLWDQLPSLGSGCISGACSYQYLRVHLTSSLFWAFYINSLATAVCRTHGYMRHYLRHAPSHLREWTWEAYVRHKPEYPSATWNSH